MILAKKGWMLAFPHRFFLPPSLNPSCSLDKTLKSICSSLKREPMLLALSVSQGCLQGTKEAMSVTGFDNHKMFSEGWYASLHFRQRREGENQRYSMTNCSLVWQDVRSLQHIDYEKDRCPLKSTETRFALRASFLLSLFVFNICVRVMACVYIHVYKCRFML